MGFWLSFVNVPTDNMPNTICLFYIKVRHFGSIVDSTLPMECYIGFNQSVSYGFAI